MDVVNSMFSRRSTQCLVKTKQADERSLPTGTKKPAEAGRLFGDVTDAC